MVKKSSKKKKKLKIKKKSFNTPFQSLGKLKKQILTKEKKIKAPTAKLEKLEQDDYYFFLKAMNGTTPFKTPNNRLTKKISPADFFKLSIEIDEDKLAIQSLSDLIDGRVDCDLRYTDEYLEGQLKNLDPNTMDAFRKGHFGFQDHLDLHGLTLFEAEKEVLNFILKAVNNRYTCVLLIHGRGLGSKDGIGILKRNLECFLFHPRVKRYVLAFTTAKPIDGGVGASYILLKN